MHLAAIVLIIMLVVFTYGSVRLWKRYQTAKRSSDLVEAVALDLIVIAGLLVLLFTL